MVMCHIVIKFQIKYASFYIYMKYSVNIQYVYKNRTARMYCMISRHANAVPVQVWINKITLSYLYLYLYVYSLDRIELNWIIVIRWVLTQQWRLLWEVLATATIPVARTVCHTCICICTMLFINMWIQVI